MKKDYEIKRQKAIEKELDCEFIRLNPDEKDFDMDIHINKIQNHIVQLTKKLTKKSLIDKFQRIY